MWQAIVRPIGSIIAARRRGVERPSAVAAVDVAVRQRTEEALIKLSSAIEQTGDAVIITDRAGVIEYVNLAFEKLTGYGRAEVVGQTPRILKSGQHDPAFYQQLWDTILAGDIFRAEFTNCKKNGELYVEEKTIAPIKNSQGQITHFVSTGKDMTERAQAEAALRKTEERFQLIAQATTDAVWEWDLVTGEVQWNHGLRTLFGYPAEALREHTWWMSHVHPEDIQATEASVQAAIARGEKFWTGQYRYRRADGSYAHVIDRGYVIHDESGRPARMIGAMVDITDRVLLAEAQARAALEERQRLARELHDSVTQSLYSLTLLAEAARRLAGAGDLEQVRALLGRLGETALQSLKEMRLLVYELRPLPLEKQGLAGALQQRLDAVEKRAGIKARLVVEGRLDLPARLEEELYRLVQEALNNALKHAAATSTQVLIRRNGAALELEVADNGRGFDLEAAGDGGGMGMVTMRERAQRLGADLAIDSAPGRGTGVRVRVPIAGEEPGAGSQSWPE